MAIDKLFRVEVLERTANPQRLIYAGLHQCYSADSVYDELTCKDLGEQEYGDRVVKHLLAGDRGHYSPLEAPQINFNVCYFPHSTMQQVSRHRHLSFSVQSFRYTGKRIIDFAEFALASPDDSLVRQKLEELFYLRPAGSYTDRQGKKYEYTEALRQLHLSAAYESAIQYRMNVKSHGLSEEHARGLIPFDVRQHWVMSCNVRSLCHLLDLRGTANAQLECQQLCELILPHFKEWVPEIAAWYLKNRWKKPRLAP